MKHPYPMDETEIYKIFMFNDVCDMNMLFYIMCCAKSEYKWPFNI